MPAASTHRGAATALGFSAKHLRFGVVDNLWARRGTEGPLLVLAGHTDVVPPGPLSAWHSHPFVPEIRDGALWPRGGGYERRARGHGHGGGAVARCPPEPRASLAFLLTSDEEGPAIDGTRR